ncbi:MAG: adenosylmethionine decarboxylase [Planctomycetota bacterium]
MNFSADTCTTQSDRDQQAQATDQPQPTTAVGKHCTLELYGCNASKLNDADLLTESLRTAAESAGATWLGQLAHRFEPQGVTALGLLAESHISIHTWPELGYAAADVFTCGEQCDPALACRLLARAVGADSYTLKQVPRASRLRRDEHGEYSLDAVADPEAVRVAASN